MKFAAVLAVLAFASPLNAYVVPRTGNGALAAELQDFADIIPLDDIVALLHEYVNQDSEMQAWFNYLQTNEFRNLVSDLESIPEFRDVLNYEQNAGLDAYYLANKINDFLHLSKLVPPNRVRRAVTGGIRGYLDQVEAMLPMEQIRALFRQKLANSKVFADFIHFLGSPTSQRLVDAVCAKPAFNNLLVKLQGYGVNLKKGRDFMENQLGLHVSCSVYTGARIMKSYHSLRYLDISIYLFEYVPVYIKKPSRQKIHEVLQSSHEATMKVPVVLFTAIFAFATVNSHYLPDFGKGPLHEDIQYFLDLIPMDKVASVVLEYAAEDSEFQELLQYFSTSQFKTMVSEIESLYEFHKFADYLERNGVYIYAELNKLNKIIGIPPFQQFSKTKITGGVKGLFEDVKQLISYDLIIRGYVYKMRTSDAWRDFIAQLKSEDNQKFVDALYENRNYLSFRAMLVKKGIDIVLIEDIIYTVLGIEFPIFEMPKSETFASDELSKDIHDFLNLVDENKIMNIVMSYLEDDEVQRAIEYMYSEAFHDLVRKVEAMPEYQNLVKYMEDSGLDMTKVISKIHKLFGMEDYVPPMELSSMNTLSNLGGLKALFNAVENALPLDKFTAMYNEKMQTSPAFQNFMQRLHSDEFQRIVNTVYQSPIFLEMRQKVINDGVDLVPIRDFIEKVLGIHLPRVNFRATLRAETFASDELSKDIHDFLNLVDENKIMNIVMSYLEDDEVQRAIEYMYSEAFHDLVRKVEAMPEYQDLVKYMEDSGLDMTKVISKIHKLFGMEDYVPPMELSSMNTLSNLGGLKALFNAVENALPLDKFTAMYNEKMQTSPAFQNFMQRLHSNEFQRIVNTVYQSPIFLEMRQKVINDGVDLVPIRDFIEKVLGIHLPRVNFLVFQLLKGIYH
ncbi:uncharacterized protein [Bombus fervidus]|uniref:uncharacterized protein n=1 Tax=Bombus fervidus TaxID=203811 RepID=UPI003AB8FFDE